MKKIFTIVVSMLFCFPIVNIGQQLQQSVPLSKDVFRDAADNIGYWKQAAELNLVLANQSIPVKPAEPVKYPRGGNGLIDQMGTDVCVWDETGVTQSENSIAIHPNNDGYLLNSNNSESGGSIYGANYLNSYNAGSSWSGSKQGAGGSNKGDPAAAISANGRRYVGFISSDRGQGIAWSDNGSTWNPVSVIGPFSYPNLMDKNHLTVDPRSSGSYSGYVYSAWTHFETGDAADAEIEFSRSTNNGVSWSTPYVISSGVNALSHNQGVNIQTGPGGQVYAVWVIYDNWGTTYNEDAIGFARSINGGFSFNTATRIHNNILGIRPSPYTPTSNATGKSMRCNSFPSMAVDISGGPNNGDIYVVWSNIGVPGTNTGTNVSVYCMKSSNGGISWGTPVRVNQGTTANGYASFFPWISCDPVTGKLYCVFYDDRNLGSLSADCEVWCAYSEDGGLSWDDFRVGDVSFTPAAIPGLATGYMGDYLGIAARNNKVYPTWTDNRSGRALTYVSPIEFTDYCIGTGGGYEYISNVTLGSINNSSNSEGYENYTNLSTDIEKGSSNTLSVTIGNGFTGDDLTAWIDYNRDGDFNDANEEIGYVTGIGTQTINFTAPTNIYSGPCTMRIRLSYLGAPPADPCGSTTYGEVEDYTVNIYEYCVAGGGCYEHISNVQIGSINNSSGCDEYKDYTNLSTNIDYLSSAAITVTNGATIYPSDQCGIWVDWNNDTDFNDANETITVSGTPGIGPYTATIDPPVGVVPGPKTMRVRITYTGTVSPCGTTSYGEVEDYTINVTGPNTWIGGYNHYWHQAANWSAGHIPLAGEDVIIPNVNQPVYVDSYPGFTQENCNDLDIASGASVEIRNMGLVVNGNLTVDGEITMVEDDGFITIFGNTIWNTGSSFDATAYSTYINAYGNWNFESGSNFAPTTGFVDFEGSTDNWIRSYSSTSNFYIMRVYKTGGAAARVSNLSTEDLVINGLTFVGPNAAFNSLSNYNVEMNGAFNYYGTFDFTLNSNTGSAVFNGSTQYINNYSSGSGTFNNVVFSSSAGTIIISGDINVEGNVTINEGHFDPGASPVYVGGNWNNSVGDAGFVEAGTHVIFNGGNYHQYCSDEIFGLLEINKAAGGAFRMNGTDVVCDAYEWTAGAVDVLTGSFTANDIPANIIEGAFYVNTGGTINLINSGTGTYADLNGELHNFGGTINITGSISYWPYLGDASVEMTGGVIDLTSCGLYISSSHTLTTNITGGIIRMNGGFSGNRADFTPTAGIIELYGTDNVFMSQSNGSTVYYCDIDKSSKNSGAGQKSMTIPDGERKDPTINANSEVNTASLSSDFVVTGNLDIQSGSLKINGNQLDVANNIEISGNLIMDNVADVINGGNEIIWNTGATEQVSNGVFNLDYRMLFHDGSNVQIGSGNTLNLIGSGTTAIRNYSSVAELGNLNVAMPPSSGTCFISFTTTYPVVVSGDLNVYTDNYFHIQEYDVIVIGNMDIAPGATVQLGSVAGSGYLEVSGDLNNDGTLILDFDETAKLNPGTGEDISSGTAPSLTESKTKNADNPDNTDWYAGEVYNHGHFSQSATGTTEILGGGTFICDEPTTALVQVLGTFNLDDGVFEISNNHLRLNAVCNINGGIIRSGGTFWATIAGNFQPTAGVVELIGSGSSGQYINVNSTNYFYNLLVDRTNTIQIYTGTELHVLNDFTILGGGLNTNTQDMYVGGDWDNQVGTGAFLESTGKVVFNGPGPTMQFINSDEQFNLLENNTNQAIRVNSEQDTVECNSYNWLSGGVSVSLGTFIAYDLAQSGLYGNWYSLGNAEIYLYQDNAQFVDLFGSTIFVNGGLMKVSGGNDESYWSSAAANTVEINSGGVLDFDGPGITIWNSQPLTYDFTGGTLKTSGWFTCLRTDFNPAGMMEFYGGNDSWIDIAAGSSFNDLLVNKSGGDKSSYTFKDRDGKTQNGSKSNSAYIYNNDLAVDGNLTIDDGKLDINTYALTVHGNANINNGGILWLRDNSNLFLDNNSELHVNNGGLLYSVATATNEALITHVSGYYDLWIENGGSIAAAYTIFEYMSNAGVYLRPGSTVYAINSFNNCTFQNGIVGGNMLTIYNTQSFIATNVSFPSNTWGGAYNVYKNVNSGDVYLPDATGGFAGETYEFDPYDLVHWDYAPLTFNLKVFMEGPYDAGTAKMRTDINSDLPLTQPFGPTLPYYGNPMPDWYYSGSENVASIPNASIVDWVLVQFRDATSPAAALPSTAIATVPAFVMNTGEVRALDGNNPLAVSAAYSNNLYVAVWNRNHLGVLSSAALVESGGVYSYDFSTGAGQAFGSNAQKDLGSGVYGMISGDGNGDGGINTVDESSVWETWAGEMWGYSPADFNFDMQTDNIDKNDFWEPNQGAGSHIPE